MVDKKCYQPVTIDRWVVVVYERKERFSEDAARDMVKKLLQQFAALGMSTTFYRGMLVSQLFAGIVCNEEDPVVVWEPSGDMGGVWAPEVHFIDGKYYVYVAVTENGDNSGHRMHVLEGDATDPLQPYKHVGNVSTSDDNWAIDGTVMQVGFVLLFGRRRACLTESGLVQRHKLLHLVRLDVERRRTEPAPLHRPDGWSHKAYRRTRPPP